MFKISSHQICDLTAARADPGVVGQLDHVGGHDQPLGEVVGNLKNHFDLDRYLDNSIFYVHDNFHPYTSQLVALGTEAQLQFHVKQLLGETLQEVVVQREVVHLVVVMLGHLEDTEGIRIELKDKKIAQYQIKNGLEKM